MFGYIAESKIVSKIEEVCKNNNILILSKETESIKFEEYINDKNINFNLIKFIFIQIDLLKNTNEEIIESIYNISKKHKNLKIIIFAHNYNEQDILLTNLYELGFYNIITDNIAFEEKLNMIITKGLSKKNSKKYKKVVIKKNKNNYISNIKKDILKYIKHQNEKKLKNMGTMSTIIIEIITKFLKALGYIIIFILTSIRNYSYFKSGVKTNNISSNRIEIRKQKFKI